MKFIELNDGSLINLALVTDLDIATLTHSDKTIYRVIFSFSENYSLTETFETLEQLESRFKELKSLLSKY